MAKSLEPLEKGGQIGNLGLRLNTYHTVTIWWKSVQ